MCVKMSKFVEKCRKIINAEICENSAKFPDLVTMSFRSEWIIQSSPYWSVSREVGFSICLACGSVGGQRHPMAVTASASALVTTRNSSTILTNRQTFCGFFFAGKFSKNISPVCGGNGESNGWNSQVPRNSWRPVCISRNVLQNKLLVR